MDGIPVLLRRKATVVTFTPPKNDRARKAWLASLKDGDYVAVVGPPFSYSARVQRSPLRCFVVKTGHWMLSQFTLTTGKGMHDRWLMPLTDELRVRIEHEALLADLRRRLRGFSWYAGPDGATDDKVLACAAILWPEEFKS